MIAVGGMSYLALPNILQRSLVTVQYVDDADEKSMNTGVLESLACGALPVTNSYLELSCLDLGDVPTYGEQTGINRLLETLTTMPQDTVRRALVLSKTVRDRHSYARRAAQFHLELVKHSAQPPRRGMASLVGFFPPDAATSYQAMLMSGLASAGMGTYPVPDVTKDTSPHSRSGTLANFVLHILEADAIVGSAITEDDAAAVLQHFKDRVFDHRRRAGKLIWTNNGATRRSAPADLRRPRTVPRRAGRRHPCPMPTGRRGGPHHQSNPGREAAACIPSGWYTGYLPDAVSRTVARERIGLGSDNYVSRVHPSMAARPRAPSRRLR